MRHSGCVVRPSSAGLEDLSQLQRMMLESASPSRQPRALLRGGGQAVAGIMLTRFMLTDMRRRFAGHPALACNLTDALGRSHVTDWCDASAGYAADDSGRTKSHAISQIHSVYGRDI
jgi:hypothetical protein